MPQRHGRAEADRLEGSREKRRAVVFDFMFVELVQTSFLH